MLYQFAFYVPETHLEAVKEALFAAGAGRIGDYQRCAWQTLGQGQFEPLLAAQPFIGQVGQRECLAEYKVEMVIDEAHLTAALQAFFNTHPYEEPAYFLQVGLDARQICSVLD
ncbi:MAG: NGG1p interacting factor NIF3 [Thiotrichales bacterium]|nr:NGG1p interacting factor NIF3 [Thiotrichales bacterium]